MNDKKMDENKQAILLLTSYFSKPKKGDFTPLTQTEYGRFALWLRENNFQPSDLFHRYEEIGTKWIDPKAKITRERLKFLLGRGMSMGLALEKWQSAGIWVLTRAEPEYPVRLKQTLRENAPAILFGVGSKKILNAGGLAVIGSRDIDDADQAFTRDVARQAALEGLNVVSGGARGVDETAMLAAAEIDGMALGILANDLFKAALSSKWRSYLKGNQVTLISPYYPEAGFNAGNAMGRNKYIYCLSDYALVVRAEEGSGGTWAGAIENNKKEWVPLFVKSDSKASGNAALIEKGASPLKVSDSNEWLCNALKAQNKVEKATPKNVEPAPTPELDEVPRQLETNNTELLGDTLEERAVEHIIQEVEESSTIEEPVLAKEGDHDLSDFDIFVAQISEIIIQKGQITLAQIKDLRKDLKPKQITTWLVKAEKENLVQRKGRARTYTKVEADLFS